MKNYKNSLIYCIYNIKYPNDIFIDSTTTTLKNRKNTLKNYVLQQGRQNDPLLTLLLSDSYSHLKVIEKYPCENITQLKERVFYHKNKAFKQRYKTNKICCNFSITE